MATRRVIAGFVDWAGCIRVVRVCGRARVPVTWTFGDDARTKRSSWRECEVWEKEWAYEGKGKGKGKGKGRERERERGE
jgi:hypothetical protein